MSGDIDDGGAALVAAVESNSSEDLDMLDREREDRLKQGEVVVEQELVEVEASGGEVVDEDVPTWLVVGGH